VNTIVGKYLPKCHHFVETVSKCIFNSMFLTAYIMKYSSRTLLYPFISV